MVVGASSRPQHTFNVRDKDKHASSNGLLGQGRVNSLEAGSKQSVDVPFSRSAHHLLDVRFIPHAVHVFVDTIKEVREELLAAQRQ